MPISAPGALLQRTLRAGSGKGIVGDPVWQEALVQHCLREFKGSLLPRTFAQALAKAL